MQSSDKTITLRELLKAYVESLRPQVHQVMTDHTRQTVAAFEAALRVRLPRQMSDVPNEWRGSIHAVQFYN